MPPRTLHTERLDLVPWAPADARVLGLLARAPGAVPSIARDPRFDPAHPEAVSASILHHWEAHGFGWRTIAERSAGAVVGFVGVSYVGPNELGLDPADFELGCWVHPAHWRRGLAAEASTAVIDEAFTHLGAASVMGCAAADHRASIDGASALGLQLEDRRTTPAGDEIVVLRVEAQSWAAAHGRAASA